MWCTILSAAGTKNEKKNIRTHFISIRDTWNWYVVLMHSFKRRRTARFSHFFFSRSTNRFVCASKVESVSRPMAANNIFQFSFFSLFNRNLWCQLSFGKYTKVTCTRPVQHLRIYLLLPTTTTTTTTIQMHENRCAAIAVQVSPSDCLMHHRRESCHRRWLSPQHRTLWMAKNHRMADGVNFSTNRNYVWPINVQN